MLWIHYSRGIVEAKRLRKDCLTFLDPWGSVHTGQGISTRHPEGEFRQCQVLDLDALITTSVQLQIPKDDICSTQLQVLKEDILFQARSFELLRIAPQHDSPFLETQSFGRSRKNFRTCTIHYSVFDLASVARDKPGSRG